MSTRGVYGFRKGRATKVMYNHMDSYPSVLGTNVVEYVITKTVEEMKSIFDRIVMVKEDGIVPYPQRDEAVKCGLYKEEELPKEGIEWYSFLRDVQGDISSFERFPYMINSKEFLKDSLFCEWGYIIELDAQVLEVYKGFQHTKPLAGRYQPKEASDPVDGYWGCALIAAIPLADLEATWKNFSREVEE